MIDRVWRDRLLTGMTVVMTVTAVIVGGHRIWRARYPLNPHTQHVKDWQRYATAGIREGAKHPRVTVVEFADFQCPFCRAASPVIHSLLKQYPRDVAFVYRHFAVHKFGFAAAVAAECAHRAGHFGEYHDLLFARQDSIGATPWTTLAREAGIRDTNQFVRCLSAPAVRAVVVADTIAARELGATGTPTFLINDLEVQGFPGADSLKFFVRSALNGAR